MQDPIKDHEKRSYTMNYENTITTASTTAWSANQVARITKIPLKTNLVPKSIRVIVNCGMDFQTIATNFQTLNAQADSFDITVFGQTLQIQPNVRNEFEIDCHNLPSLQQMDQTPQLFVQNIDVTQPFFNVSVSGGAYWNAANQQFKLFVQAIIRE